MALAGTGTYVFDNIVDQLVAVFNVHSTWMHFVLDILLLLLISLIVLIFGEIVPKALGLSFPTKYVNTYSRIVVAAGRFGISVHLDCQQNIHRYFGLLQN